MRPAARAHQPRHTRPRYRPDPCASRPPPACRPSEDLADAREVLRLAARYSIIAPCAGLHPVQPLHSEGAPYSGARCVSRADLPAAVDFIRQHAESLVAIGEVGASKYENKTLKPSPAEGGGDGARPAGHGWAAAAEPLACASAR